jgi:hypothetical protein
LRSRFYGEGWGISDDRNDFEMRKQGKTYFSNVLSFKAHNREEIRNIRMVLEGSDKMLLGEIQGALCLRLSGNKLKTQVGLPRHAAVRLRDEGWRRWGR